MVDRITLGFGADITEVERATDDMSRGLEDTADALEDVGKAGEDAGQAAADGLDGAGAATDDVAGKLGDLGNVATDVLEGDFAGAAQSGITALTGLAAAIPGIGALIGSGLATIANGFIARWEDAAEATEDRIAAMYEDMKTSGNNFLSSENIAKEINAILNDADRYQEAQDAAALSGSRLALVLRAEAGDQLAIQSVLAGVAQQRRELTAAQDEYVDRTGDTSAAIEDQLSSLDVLAQKYGYVGTEQDSAAARAELFRQATENAGEATGNLNDKLNDLPGAVGIDIVVDTAAAEDDVDRFVARVRNRRIRIPVEGVDAYGRRID